jgi:hypothetical protein
MSKGSKPRPYNYETFSSNFENIAWDFIVCSECGAVHKYDRKNISVKYDYEEKCWKCIKGNFN